MVYTATAMGIRYFGKAYVVPTVCAGFCPSRDRRLKYWCRGRLESFHEYSPGMLSTASGAF
jgi:hypothetical protein